MGYSKSTGRQGGTFRLQKKSQPKPLILLFLFAVIASAALFDPMSAEADVPVGLEVKPFEVQAYQESFDLPVAVAERNLATQQRGAGIVDLMKAVEGKRFAGVWFDNQSGEFVVPVLANVDSAAIRSALTDANVENNSHTELVRYSWEELTSAQTRLDKDLTGLLEKGLLRTSIKPQTNAIVAEFPEGITVDQQAEITQAATESEVSIEIQKTQSENLRFQNMSCQFEFKRCSQPLRGGVGIKKGGTWGPECTAGFKAVGNIFGNRFMLTAGHCVVEGEVYKWYAETPSNEAPAIGLAEAVDFPGGDWAAIKANGSYWDTSPWPSQVAFWEHGLEAQETAIETESASYMGEYVCHAGLTTGGHCGPVVALNVTGEGSRGLQYHLVMFGPTCAEEGDSGGPVFVGHIALGLLSARVLPPHGCGADYGLYTEITEAADTMDVTVGPRLGAPPYAESEEATGVGGKQATFNGLVNPHGITTNYHFEYGTTQAYGSSTQLYGAGSGWQTIPVAGTIYNLNPHTTYHYRIVAQNSAGTSYGVDEEVTTPPLPPEVTTETPTGVLKEKATLHGSVNPLGLDTQYQFEYGKTTSYGTKVPVASEDIGAEWSTIALANAITGLEVGTTYHYRIVATNSAGTSSGSDVEFKTPSKPVATTEPASYTNTFEPQLNASVDPERADTHSQFEYGKTTSYGTKIPVTVEDIGAGDTPVTVGQYLKGLERNTTYHYRVVAENEVGVTKGADQSFTSLPLCKGPEAKCVWSTKTAADPPPATEDEMKGVSCASSTMCIAVGRDLYKKNSFIELWNGTAWSLLQSTSGEIRQVTCPATTACVAVGASSSGGIQSWMIYTLGGGWIVEGVTPPTPTGGTEANLQGVSCTTTNCTAVGSYKVESSYKPLVERWNGASWSLQSAPSPIEGTAQKAMLSVSCSAPTYCVAVGEAANKPVAQRWNGTEWSLMSAPNPSGAKGAKLASVSCTSSTSCMAAGDYYETTSNEKTLAERWNGSSWSISSSPNPSEAKGFVNFTGVSCTSSTSCTAAGYYSPNVSGGFPLENKTLVESWNGTTWTIQSSPNPSGQAYSALLGVSCTSSTGCTAVGGSQPGLNSAPATLVERWNGTSWSIQSAINPSTAVEDELKSVVCGSTTLCIAVGKDLYKKGSFVDLWNGTEWKYLQGTPGEIKHVSCTSAVACVAVGVSGAGSPQSWMIFEYEHTGSWIVSEVAPPTPSGGSQTVLQGVSCIATACTAVGSYNSESGYKPLVERWNGSTWSLQTAPNPAEGSAVNAMLSVSCNSSTSCVAVGEAASKPVAERWNGSEWSLTSPPNPDGAKGAKLAGVSCGSLSSCMAVGDYYETTSNEKTLVERWNGSSWSIITSPNPSEAKGFVNFTDVSCLSPNSCFTAGYYSSNVSGGASLENKTLVETWNGTEWTIQSSTNAAGKPYSVLFGISCTSSIACTAVGAGSTGFFSAPSLLVERYE